MCVVYHYLRPTYSFFRSAPTNHPSDQPGLAAGSTAVLRRTMTGKPLFYASSIIHYHIHPYPSFTQEPVNQHREQAHSVEVGMWETEASCTACSINAPTCLQLYLLISTLKTEGTRSSGARSLQSCVRKVRSNNSNLIFRNRPTVKWCSELSVWGLAGLQTETESSPSLLLDPTLRINRDRCVPHALIALTHADTEQAACKHSDCGGNPPRGSLPVSGADLGQS